MPQKTCPSCGQTCELEWKFCMFCMNEFPEISPIDMQAAKLAEILFQNRINEEAKERERQEEQKRQEDQKRKKEEEEKERYLQNGNEAKCPRCRSTSLYVDRQGYGYGKGSIGLVLLGPLGAFAGGIGSKKVQVHCIKCGHRWTL